MKAVPANSKNMVYHKGITLLSAIRAASRLVDE